MTIVNLHRNRYSIKKLTKDNIYIKNKYNYEFENRQIDLNKTVLCLYFID